MIQKEELIPCETSSPFLINDYLSSPKFAQSFSLEIPISPAVSGFSRIYTFPGALIAPPLLRQSNGNRMEGAAQDFDGFFSTALHQMPPKVHLS